MKRALLLSLALAILVIAGGVFWLSVHGSTLIRDAVREHGSPILGADIRLSRLGFSPFAGEAHLEGLEIANPEGFSDADAIRVEGIALELEPLSLFSSPVHIESLAISRPEIRVEPGAKGLNLDRLRQNVNAYMAGLDGDDAASPETRLRIDRLTISGARFVVGGGAIGFSDQALALPDIELEDIGGETGALPADVAAVLLDAVLPQIKKALASEAGRELLAQARDRLGGIDTDMKARLEEKAGDLREKLDDELGEKTGEKVEGAVKKGLDSLFKRKKKEDEETGGGGSP